MEEIAGRYDQQLNRSRQLVIKKEIWVKHYSSNHQILLVGEGDFSFALSLAVSFRPAFNIVASSLDSYVDVIRNYKSAKTNVDRLCSLGARLLFGVDARTMKSHPDLHLRKYDRIVYNFPHAGFSGKEDDEGVIMMHKNLVFSFFTNASQMLRPKGEVHVSHKTKFPFNDWNIKELASQSCLWLLDRVEFKLEDYPGYINKRGDGSRCDEPFHLGECCTFKFISLSTDLYHRNHQLEEILLQRANASLFTNPDECFKIFVDTGRIREANKSFINNNKRTRKGKRAEKRLGIWHRKKSKHKVLSIRREQHNSRAKRSTDAKLRKRAESRATSGAGSSSATSRQELQCEICCFLSSCGPASSCYW